MKVRLNILLLFLLMSMSVASSALPVHKFVHYTSGNGLQQHVIQYILQDEEGLLWFASWDGLYSYDGYRFKLWKSKNEGIDSPSTYRINNLSLGRWGYLWMTSYDGCTFRFNRHDGEYQKVTDNRQYRVSDIQTMSDGLVWLSTYQQTLLLVRCDSTSGKFDVIDFFSAHNLSKPSRINHLFLDSKGRHWILTQEGAFCYEPQTEKVTLIVDEACEDIIEENPYIGISSTNGQMLYMKGDDVKPVFQQLDTKSTLKLICKIDNQHFVIGTGSDGFFIINPTKRESKHYTTANCPEMNDNAVREIFVDSYQGLWIRTSGYGVLHFDPKTEKSRRFQIFDIYNHPITNSRSDLFFVEDKNHEIWVHPSGGGLGWYDRRNDQLIPFYNPLLQNGWTNTDQIEALFCDQQGSLWFCSNNNGLQKVTFPLFPFKLFSYNQKTPDYSANNFRSMMQDQDGIIWIGGRDGRIHLLNKDYELLGNLCSDGSVQIDHDDSFGSVYSIIQSRDGIIWIGTKGNGLLMAKKVAGGNSPRFQLQHFVASDENTHALNSNRIYSLHEDHNGRIWIATYDEGINIMERDQSGQPTEFYSSRNGLKDYPSTYCSHCRFVTSDSKGNIWIGTTGGLLRSQENFANPQSLIFQRFNHSASENDAINNDDVQCVLETNDHRLFLSTFGGGISEIIQEKDGKVRFLPFFQLSGRETPSVVFSMVEDHSHKIWCSTEAGFVCWDEKTGEVSNFPKSLFRTRLNLSEGQAAKQQNGNLLFGTTNGLVHFNPDSIQISSFSPVIHFEKDSVLIRQGQHRFELTFSALDYISPEAIEYAYRLNGFEKEWHYVGTQHDAVYTNLKPGKYQLEVMSTNSSGNWTDNKMSIPVEVLPDFWHAWYGKLLSSILLLLFLVLALHLYKIFFNLRHKFELEQQMTDMKLKFFTNVSHELRTPLTLITGPLENLQSRKDISTEVAGQLEIISNNANKMLRLVNQILDLRKAQNGMLKLSIENFDLVEFVSKQVGDFRLLADKMKTELTYTCPQERITIWADIQKLGVAVNNLISNAFKYSKPGQPIKVAVWKDNTHAYIRVQDSGEGIAQEKIKELFKRFGSNVTSSPSGMESSGIGLSLTKEIVELHKGEIDVESQQGKGTTFCISLLLGNSHYAKETDFIVNDNHDNQINSTEEDKPSVQPTEENTEKPTILVVEDNEELRNYIHSIFAENYEVIEAVDGVDGWKKANDTMPDLVISDVMMPNLDGFGLAQKMRASSELSHIPLVLLTALSDNINKLQGLRSGIDDYITKPFSSTYLIARIENILQKRHLLQAYYLRQISAQIAPVHSAKEESLRQDKPETTENIGVLPSLADQNFIDLVTADLKKNLSKADYGVNEMASATNMSRSAYGKKVKALLGQSPTIILHNMRMEKAAELISTSDMSLSEISYEIGYADPHYFGKCFKNYFGKTATEYKKDLTKS